MRVRQETEFDEARIRCRRMSFKSDEALVKKILKSSLSPNRVFSSVEVT